MDWNNLRDYTPTEIVAYVYNETYIDYKTAVKLAKSGKRVKTVVRKHIIHRCECCNSILNY